MSKIILQDMVKVNSKRRVERVIVPTVERTKPKIEHIEMYSAPKRRGNYMLWIVTGISCLFLVFAASQLFLKVTVTVNPKVQDLNLNQSFEANIESGGDTLPFNLVILSGEETTKLQATAQKDVAQKAKGRVRIYNNFSAASQKLNIDTRLLGSNGKTYKTETSTIVPGRAKDGTPGSVEVGIYANEAGVEYNSEPLDFTIIGFKGTPKYTKFDVKSITKGAISGGFKGLMPVVSDEEKINAIATMKTTLQSKLIKKATDQIPEGFILYKDAVFLDVNTDDNAVSTVSASDNSISMNMKGTLYGILFNEKKLTEKIAKENVAKYDGSPVYIPNIRDLTFSLSDKDHVSFADVENIHFNLKGTSKIVWTLDKDKFLNDLFRQSKKNFNEILLRYPSIESAKMNIRPPWRGTLPDKAKDIDIIINYPN